MNIFKNILNLTKKKSLNNGYAVKNAPGGYYSPGMGTYDPKPFHSNTTKKKYK